MTTNKPSDLPLFSLKLPPVPISGETGCMNTLTTAYPDQDADQWELNGSLQNSIHINSIAPYWLARSKESLFWFLSS